MTRSSARRWPRQRCRPFHLHDLRPSADDTEAQALCKSHLLDGEPLSADEVEMLLAEGSGAPRTTPIGVEAFTGIPRPSLSRTSRTQRDRRRRRRPGRGAGPLAVGRMTGEGRTSQFAAGMMRPQLCR